MSWNCRVFFFIFVQALAVQASTPLCKSLIGGEGKTKILDLEIKTEITDPSIHDIPRSWLTDDIRVFVPGVGIPKYETPFQLVRGTADLVDDITLARKFLDPRRGGPGFAIGKLEMLLRHQTPPLEKQIIDELRRGVMRAGEQHRKGARGVELFYENHSDRKLYDIAGWASEFKQNFLDSFVRLPEGGKDAIVRLIVQAETQGRQLMPEEIRSDVQVRYIKLIAYEDLINGRINTQRWHADGGVIHALLIPLENLGPEIVFIDRQKNQMILFPSNVGSFVMMSGQEAAFAYPDVYKKMLENSYDRSGGTLHRSPRAEGNRLVVAVFWGNQPRRVRGTIYPKGYQIRTDIDPK